MSDAQKHHAIDEDKISGKIYDRRLLQRLLSYGKPYWHLILLAVLMIIIAAGLETVGPYLTRLAVDEYIIPGDYAGLVQIIVIYVSVLVANFFIRYLQILLTQYVGQKIIYDLRNQLFSHLQYLHQQFYDKNPVGRLMTRVTSDVESLNQMFTQGLVMIFSGLLICALGLRQLWWRADSPVETAAAETIVVPFDAHPATQRLLPLLAGLLNGFVPCSLVFSVAVKTVAVADPLQAVLLMFSFGLGTLPTMLGVTLSGALVGRFSRGCWQRVTGTLIFAFGAWTLYEGWSFFDIMRGLVG